MSEKYDKYKEVWNEIAEDNDNLVAKKVLNETHKSWINAREKEKNFFERFKKTVEKIDRNPTLQNKSWLDFEFLIRIRNAQSGVAKILDGKYDFMLGNDPKNLQQETGKFRGKGRKISNG